MWLQNLPQGSGSPTVSQIPGLKLWEGFLCPTSSINCVKGHGKVNTLEYTDSVRGLNEPFKIHTTVYWKAHSQLSFRDVFVLRTKAFNPELLSGVQEEIRE